MMAGSANEKKSTTEFQTQLWEAVNAIEQDSRVEVVVVIRSVVSSVAVTSEEESADERQGE